MKRIALVCLTFVMASASLYGCGSKEKTETVDNSVSTDSVTNDNESMNSSNQTDIFKSNESNDVETTTEPALMTIANARKFNSNVAWVNSGSKWCIVDTDGNVINSFPSSYTIATDFEGGFSLIDPNATTYMSGRIETSNEAKIVNSLGEIVFDLQANGYSGLTNYDGLSEGSIIVKKNIDTFDKSGDFYYHYDLNTGVEKEICPYEEESDKGYKENCGFEYMGDGFYIRTLWDGMNGTFYQSREVLVFHNYISDEVLSFRESPEIVNTLNGNSTFKDWDTWRIDGELITEVNDRFFVINLKDRTCTPANIDYSMVDNTYGNYIAHTTEIGVGHFLCRWGDIIQINYETENHYFDFVKNRYYHFEPNCDYECEIVDYRDGYFLVTTKNENNTAFFTILDENLNPLFSPKRYSDTTSLIKHYLLSNEEDNSVTVTNLQDMTTLLMLDNAAICYTDNQNERIWTITNQNSTECYDIKSGNLLFKLDGAYEILSDYDSGYALIRETESNQYMYVNEKGESLKIVDNSVS